MERSELVRALRCVVTVMDERTCENCPFYQKEELPEYMTDTYPDDFLCSCDTDRIALMAADLIEAQAREIEALRKQVPQWVSVTERLPENDGLVLTNSATGEQRVLSHERGKRDWTLSVNPWHHFLIPGNSVTHWMPLPEAPKEAEKDG